MSRWGWGWDHGGDGVVWLLRPAEVAAIVHSCAVAEGAWGALRVGSPLLALLFSAAPEKAEACDVGRARDGEAVGV